MIVEEAISKKVDEADGLAVGLVDSLRELVCNNRGEEITATHDQAGTADELPCADSIGGIVEEALSQKVGEAVELTIGLVDSLWELVCEN